jgi:predicted phosphodiesterase
VRQLMRYGVISDVHANFHALTAAIEFLDRAGVDRYLCLGDIVGYGAFPNECARLVAELDAVCVAGNHDLIITGRLSDQGAGALARSSLAWTREVLKPDVRRFLQAMPLSATPEAAVVMTHASLVDPERYVARDEDIRHELHRLAQGHPRARLLLLGHTHRVLAHGEQAGRLLRRGTSTIELPKTERVLVNPGSVGQSRQWSPHGRVAVLEWPAAVVTFHVVRYDDAAARRALQARGFPADSYHRRPSALRAAARRSPRLVAAKRRLVRATRSLSGTKR